MTANPLRSLARGLLALMVAFIVLCAATVAARAQPAQCGGYADILGDLAQAYHERIVWAGERGEAGQLVITAKPDGSTWTAMLVRGGVACLVAAGTGWAAMGTGEDI